MNKKLPRLREQEFVRSPRFNVSPRARAAFTLTELMVAVVVLLAVIIATSKIFGTASKITGMGNAAASVMQEAASIQQQLQRDFDNLSAEGFFAIHCVAVPNDIHVASGGGLLNPNLLASAKVRADQMVFFTNTVETVQTYHISSDSRHRGQGTAVRMYWGHGFQLPEALATIPDPNVNLASAHDPNPPSASPLTPWYRSATNVAMVRLLYGGVTAAGGGNNTNLYGAGSGSSPSVNGNQPDARQWLLCRQPVSLMDDDTAAGNTNSKTVFLGEVTTARSIFMNTFNNNALPWGFSREIRNGRMDAAATQLDDIRRWIVISNPATPAFRPWNNPALVLPQSDQRNIIKSAVYYPRAERKAPGMHRVDQALTNHVIGSACSNFTIEWTYDDGVGYIKSRGPDFQYGTLDDGQYLGVIINPRREQPWFGLPDIARGISCFADIDHQTAAQYVPAQTIYTAWPAPTPNNRDMGSIENTITTAGVQNYWATFGYNQNQPLNNNDVPDIGLGFTPFPSAVRVTMTLHDPERKLENGREFQFVIRLPKRVN